MSFTGITYIILVSAGLLLSLSGRPAIGLYTYLFTFYAFAPGRWWGQGLPDLRWSLVAATVTLISIYINKTKKHKMPAQETQGNWFKRPEVILFALFVVWFWMQKLWAISGPLHDEGAILVTKYLILFYLVQRAITKENQIIQFMVVNMLGAAYLGWLGWTMGASGRFENIGMPGIDDANLLATHLAAVMLPSSLFLLGEFGKKKYLAIPFVAMILNGIFLTQSRGALTGFVFAGILILILKSKRVSKQFYAYALLGGMLAFAHIGDDLIKRIKEVTQSDSLEQVDKSAYSRIVILEAQWEIFKERPFIGHGHWSTFVLSPDYIDREYLTASGSKDGNLRRSSHNLLMSLLVDHGLIGTTLYMSMIFLSLMRMTSMRKKIREGSNLNISLMYMGVSVGLICILVASVFVNAFRMEIIIWYVAILGVLHDFMKKADPQDVQ